MSARVALADAIRLLEPPLTLSNFHQRRWLQERDRIVKDLRRRAGLGGSQAGPAPELPGQVDIFEALDEVNGR